jgi:hypothetical protein
VSAHEYATLASLARQKAAFAMQQGNPERAREWIAAAADAERIKTEVGAGERIAVALESIAASLTEDPSRFGHHQVWRTNPIGCPPMGPE